MTKKEFVVKACMVNAGRVYGIGLMMDPKKKFNSEVFDNFMHGMEKMADVLDGFEYFDELTDGEEYLLALEKDMYGISRSFAEYVNMMDGKMDDMIANCDRIESACRDRQQDAQTVSRKMK